MPPECFPDVSTPQTPPPRVSTRVRAVLGVLLLVALVVLVATGVVPGAQEIRGSVRDSGAWGALLFVLVYALLAALPTPAGALTIVAGGVFGFVQGLGLVVLGASLGALLGFALARYLGRGAVERLTGSRLRSLDALARDEGYLAVLVLRLLPVLPFSAVHYVCGMSSMRLRTYLVGTVVGIVPASAAYVAVGAYGIRPGSWQFLSALLGLAALTLVSGALARRVRHRLPAEDRREQATLRG